MKFCNCRRILDIYSQGLLKRKLRGGWWQPSSSPPPHPLYVRGLRSTQQGYLNLHCEKLLFDALVKLIFEYCCSV